MDKVKQWIALAVLGALVLAAGGWFLLISPKKGEAAELEEQAAAQVSTNQTLAVQLEVLKAQAQELPKKQADLAKVAAKIPTNPALPALVRALTAASTTAGVELVSVTPGAPVADAAAAPAAAPAAPAAPAPAAPAPAAPAPVGAAAAAPPAAGTLALIPLTINVVGDFYEVEQFLANLENLPRAVRVTNLAVAPGTSPTAGKTASASAATDGKSLTTTITGSVFMATGAAPATAVVAPTATPAK